MRFLFYLLSIKAKKISCLAIIIILPCLISAQPGGPTQPEVQVFEPHTTSDLVDPFTGDFTYNIPLLDVGGYPINLVYKSGITMDQEASWVGLGWTLNPGVINRHIRGLPDDFAGDLIVKETNLKDNVTTGTTIRADFEAFGKSAPISFRLGTTYNNYDGWGIDQGFSAGLRAGNRVAGLLTFSLNSSSNGGLTQSLSASVQSRIFRDDVGNQKGALNLGLTFSQNSHSGIKSLNLMGGYRDKFMRNSFKLGGIGLTFGQTTYTPYVELPLNNNSYNISFKYGTTGKGLDPSAERSGYIITQKLENKSKSFKSYGYIYADKANDNLNVLHDFNREKDGIYYPKQKKIPLGIQTFDLYSISGQGIGGLFRPNRCNLMQIFDPRSVSGNWEKIEVDYGGEVGAGDLVKAGIDLTFNSHKSKSGKWQGGNEWSRFLAESNEISKNQINEVVYFKQIGEITQMQNPKRFMNIFGGFAPTSVVLDGQKSRVQFTQQNSGQEIEMQDFIQHKREIRNKVFSFLNAKEASKFGLQKFISSYRRFIAIETVLDPQPRDIKQGRFGDRFSVYRQAHHISEIKVLREDGSTYVYGIPVYNVKKREVSFNITKDHTPSEVINGLVNYEPGIDDSFENKNGISNYYNSIETPAYPHAFLLTAILSPDYIDLTGDGPSSDDKGSYTKFNYSQKDRGFRWRSPVERNKAFYNPGYVSDIEDDKANYQYGEKELWYLHSIETKNYIAEFEISDRLDGIEIDGEAGGITEGRNNKSLWKLDSIRLFNKHERLLLKEEATPLRVVHFYYDYSLCPETPNSKGHIIDNQSGEKIIIRGKLTLKSISITHRKSQKGEASPYRFMYSEDNNFSYNPQNSDRWASYKPSATEISNNRFPYTLQENRDEADRWASAWHLTQIKLPSGGVIKVEYEADDYAYVQNKRAMSMFKIIGIADNPNGKNLASILYDKETGSKKGFKNYPYIYFNLITPISSGDEHLLKEYVKNLQKVYINAQILARTINGRNDFENIADFFFCNCKKKQGRGRDWV